MRIAHSNHSLVSAVAAAAARYRHFLPRKSIRLSRSLYRARTPALFRARRYISGDMSTISAEDNAEFGFKRSEMYSLNLGATVDQYERHVFLRYKGPADWQSHVENSEADPLPKLLFSVVKARKDDIAVKTKLTVCGGGDGTDGDVLIFPEMIKYKGLKDSDVDSFVDDVLVNGKPWASGVPEVLTGSHVFVCSHGSRDKRCGLCGPALIEKFNEEIESRGSKDQIFVNSCTHVGGHKYAGNLIIYSPDSEGNIMGHWYGYVTPDDVPALLDQHIAKGEVISRIWRGQMGAPKEENEKVEEQKLPNGNEAKKSEKLEDSSTQVINENAGGCCQGVNGFTCCRDKPSDITEEKKTKETKGLGRFSCWIGSFEQREVYTAAAVVGAVATIAVAYSIYRRSG